MKRRNQRIIFICGGVLVSLFIANTSVAQSPKSPAPSSIQSSQSKTSPAASPVSTPTSKKSVWERNEGAVIALSGSSIMVALISGGFIVWQLRQNKKLQLELTEIKQKFQEELQVQLENLELLVV